MAPEQITWMKGGLTDSEWQELVALDYVLTWNYTSNHDKDEGRYRELSKKKWDYRTVHPL